MPPMRILQFNTGRGRTASALFRALALELKVDVVFLQEPVWDDPVIRRVTSARGYFSTAQPKALTVVRNPQYTITQVNQLMESHIVVLKLSTGSGPLWLVNVYWTPASPPNDLGFLITLGEILDATQRAPLLLAGDFNAHNPLWGGETLDNRGQALEEFAAQHNLALTNARTVLPTFETVNGRSWVDITMSRGLTIADWTVLDTESASDDRFTVWTYTVNVTQEATQHIVSHYDLKAADWIAFRDRLTQRRQTLAAALMGPVEEAAACFQQLARTAAPPP